MEKVFGRDIIAAKNPISLERKQVLWHFRAGSEGTVRRSRCFSTRCTNAPRWLQSRGETRACRETAAPESARRGGAVSNCSRSGFTKSDRIDQSVAETRNTLRMKF